MGTFPSTYTNKALSTFEIKLLVYTHRLQHRSREKRPQELGLLDGFALSPGKQVLSQVVHHRGCRMLIPVPVRTGHRFVLGAWNESCYL